MPKLEEYFNCVGDQEEKKKKKGLGLLGKGQDLRSYADKDKPHLSKRLPVPKSQVGAE